MNVESNDYQEIIAKLNQVLEHELSGVIRYTHYSFMVFGYSRIPVVSWFRSAANETLQHATEAGEMITFLGSHPSLGVAPLLDSHKHDIGEILLECMEFEQQGVALYQDILTLAENSKSVTLEEYARTKITEESMHIGDIDKMLRRPGDIKQAVKTDVP